MLVFELASRPTRCNVWKYLEMKPSKTWTPTQRDLLFRKNAGRLGREAYLRTLAAFFTTPVNAENLITLEQTDAIRQRQLPVLQEQQWMSSNRPEVLALSPGWDFKEQRQMLLFAQALLSAQACYVYWAGHSDCGGLYRADTGTRINLDYDFSRCGPDEEMFDDLWFHASDDRFRLHLEYWHDEVLFDDVKQRHIQVTMLECTYTTYVTS